MKTNKKMNGGVMKTRASAKKTPVVPVAPVVPVWHDEQALIAELQAEAAVAQAKASALNQRLADALIAQAHAAQAAAPHRTTARERSVAPAPRLGAKRGRTADRLPELTPIADPAPIAYQHTESSLTQQDVDDWYAGIPSEALRGVRTEDMFQREVRPVRYGRDGTAYYAPREPEPYQPEFGPEIQPRNARELRATTRAEARAEMQDQATYEALWTTESTVRMEITPTRHALYQIFTCVVATSQWVEKQLLELIPPMAKRLGGRVRVVVALDIRCAKMGGYDSNPYQNAEGQATPKYLWMKSTRTSSQKELRTALVETARAVPSTFEDQFVRESGMTFDRLENMIVFVTRLPRQDAGAGGRVETPQWCNKNKGVRNIESPTGKCFVAAVMCSFGVNGRDESRRKAS